MTNPHIPSDKDPMTRSAPDFDVQPDIRHDATGDAVPDPGVDEGYPRIVSAVGGVAVESPAVNTPAEDSQTSAATPEDLEDDSSQRAWTPGQVREALQELRRILQDPEDPDKLDQGKSKLLLRATYRLYLMQLTSGKNDEEQAEYLGIEASSLPSYRRRVLLHALRRDRELPEEERLLTEPVFTPRGKQLGERWKAPEGNVGPRLRAILGERIPPGGIEKAIKEFADHHLVSVSAVMRFLSSKSHPLAAKMLNPFLEWLGITDEAAEEFRAAYEAERLLKFNRGSKKGSRPAEEPGSDYSAPEA